MSIILRLWDPRKDDDVTTYDFYDLDESAKDDGLWSFKSLDNDSPGDPDNDKLENNYDFYSQDTGYSDNSYFKDDEDIDFMYLSEFHEELPDVFGEDDGVWGFQSLDNDSPSDPNNDQINSEYDIGDQENDGAVSSSSYIPDNTDCEFYDIAEAFGSEFDFNDIDKNDISDNDKNYIQYNFGDLDKSPYEIVPIYFLRVLRYCIADLLVKDPFAVKLIDMNNKVVPIITLQMYYNIETNKCFIEYRFDEKVVKEYSRYRLRILINRYINSNFEYDLGYIPEIIFPEDGVNEICDSNDKLTPYVIGYWKSLSGRYEFIEDETEVMSDLMQFKIKDYGKDYKEAREKIYNTCKNSPEALWQSMIDIAMSYHIDLNQKPEKTMSDFIKEVDSLRSSFNQTILTEEQKSDYIKEYMDIYQRYHNNESQFNTKVAELDSKYGVVEGNNKNIPLVFDRFKEVYYQFFNRRLPDPYRFTKRYFISLEQK